MNVNITFTDVSPEVARQLVAALLPSAAPRTSKLVAALLPDGEALATPLPTEAAPVADPVLDQPPAPKRGRGRPRKNPAPEAAAAPAPAPAPAAAPAITGEQLQALAIDMAKQYPDLWRTHSGTIRKMVTDSGADTLLKVSAAAGTAIRDYIRKAIADHQATRANPDSSVDDEVLLG